MNREVNLTKRIRHYKAELSHPSQTRLAPHYNL
jgi:hypothetical protein